MTDPRISVLDPAGPQAATIASLWDVFLWISIAVFVLVIASFAVATGRAVGRRRRDGDGDPLAEDPVSERRMIRGIVLAGTVTVVTLLALLIASIRTGSALAALEDDAGALHVRVTGRQWWWQIEYEHDDPPHSATTANELHIPVGRTIHLELTSADVIHSFWVPSLHGKKDLIPGRINRTWLRIDEPGEYLGQCAEFCGLEHARMAITVYAEPPEVFSAWLAHQREPAAPPADGQAVRGLAVFTGSPCVLCHAIAGTSAGGRLGPDLTHAASRARLAAGALPNTIGNLAGWILDPQSVKPGSHMPATSLAPADLHALLAYLEGLR
ncbi:MAG TPA: cytochrome c oxidase subunit II [Kofleriaceae bacterium]|nr:cytochrome c oxidase subunit II [Kofleriaceae bacterium]